MVPDNSTKHIKRKTVLKFCVYTLVQWSLTEKLTSDRVFFFCLSQSTEPEPGWQTAAPPVCHSVNKAHTETSVPQTCWPVLQTIFYENSLRFVQKLCIFHCLVLLLRRLLIYLWMHYTAGSKHILIETICANKKHKCTTANGGSASVKWHVACQWF